MDVGYVCLQVKLTETFKMFAKILVIVFDFIAFEKSYLNIAH